MPVVSSAPTASTRPLRPAIAVTVRVSSPASEGSAPNKPICAPIPTWTNATVAQILGRLWAVYPSVYFSLVTMRQSQPGRRGSWTGG